MLCTGDRRLIGHLIFTELEALKNGEPTPPYGIWNLASGTKDSFAIFFVDAGYIHKDNPSLPQDKIKDLKDWMREIGKSTSRNVGINSLGKDNLFLL